MTYNVFGGTLNPAQSNPHTHNHFLAVWILSGTTRVKCMEYEVEGARPRGKPKNS